MEETTATTETQPFLSEGWFDPLETAVRGRIRGFIEEMLEGELDAALQRGRYDRHGTPRGHCHRHRVRQLIGSFGPVRRKCPDVVDSLKEAGARLFTFLRYPAEQWKSIRTTNAIERLHEEFKRRIKTQCLLPCAETACMLFWALLAGGQITLRPACRAQ